MTSHLVPFQKHPSLQVEPVNETSALVDAPFGIEPFLHSCRNTGLAAMSRDQIFSELTWPSSSCKQLIHVVAWHLKTWFAKKPAASLWLTAGLRFKAF
jgi:hypothetical protein